MTDSTSRGMPADRPDLDLAFFNLIACAGVHKSCAALLAELRRLYAAAGEPIPFPLFEFTSAAVRATPRQGSLP
jgi:hypothetical protein